jgi:hypothetical protein
MDPGVGRGAGIVNAADTTDIRRWIRAHGASFMALPRSANIIIKFDAELRCGAVCVGGARRITRIKVARASDAAKAEHETED